MDAAGHLRSAIDRIGGSKEEPQLLPIGDGFMVQEDNVAMEYNIPPAASAEELKGSINKIMAFLAEKVDHQGLQFCRLSAASFPMVELLHPKAQEFGCDPDFNAWTKRVNPRPKAQDKSLRSCGGHVHIGYDFPDMDDRVNFVKYLDLFLAVPSTLMDEGELRKHLYGKAGAYRPKTYGLEYRTLSNYWIFRDELIEWVWNSTQRAMDAWHAKRVNFKEDGKLIVSTINTNNKDTAHYLVDKYELQVV